MILDENNKLVLDEIESSADDAVIIKKEVHEKRKKKSEVTLEFDVDEDDTSLKMNLIRCVNGKQRTYQDLYDFCIARCDNDTDQGKRLAYNNIISALREKRNIRSDTIDLICEFLGVDVVLVDVEDSCGKETD